MLTVAQPRQNATSCFPSYPKNEFNLAKFQTELPLPGAYNPAYCVTSPQYLMPVNRQGLASDLWERRDRCGAGQLRVFCCSPYHLPQSRPPLSNPLQLLLPSLPILPPAMPLAM